MWSFVVIGQRALASGEFSLDDLPSSSGRADVLARCIRAALLFSHGVRHDVRLYLLLGGGPSAPRTLRIEGRTARFLRPDERSLAVLLKKALARAAELAGPGFMELKPGIALASGGLDCVLTDLGEAALYVLEAGASDVRGVALPGATAAFFIGDHLGFEASIRATLSQLGARPLSVGPVSLHSEDAITLVLNELDRRGATLRENG